MSHLSEQQLSKIAEDAGYHICSFNPLEIFDKRGYITVRDGAIKLLNRIVEEDLNKLVEYEANGRQPSKIITLCGSARFEKHFKLWNEVLSLAGHTVFSLAVYPSDKADVKNWYTEDQKQTLDYVHKKKIEASHAVVILNVDGYIGESTLSEIVFAQQRNKDLYALESWATGYSNFSDPHYHGQPVGTTSRDNVDYVFDLLGPAGKQRSALVKMIDEFKQTGE